MAGKPDPPEACIKGHLQIVKILLEASWNGERRRLFYMFYRGLSIKHISRWIIMALHGCTILSNVVSNVSNGQVFRGISMDIYHTYGN